MVVLCIACVERCLDRKRRAPTNDQTAAATPVPEALCVRPACRHRENHPLVPCSRPARASVGCPLRTPRRHKATRAIVRAPHGSIFGRVYGPTVRKTFWGNQLSRRQRNTTAWRHSRPCQARRTNGSPCCARAKRGSLYCQAHESRPRQLWSLRPRQMGHQCKATSVTTGVRCGNRAVRPHGVCWQHGAAAVLAAKAIAARPHNAAEAAARKARQQKHRDYVRLRAAGIAPPPLKKARAAAPSAVRAKTEPNTVWPFYRAVQCRTASACCESIMSATRKPVACHGFTNARPGPCFASRVARVADFERLIARCRPDGDHRESHVCGLRPADSGVAKRCLQPPKVAFCQEC
jgi:hypothetical protein